MIDQRARSRIGATWLTSRGASRDVNPRRERCSRRSHESFHRRACLGDRRLRFVRDRLLGKLRLRCNGSLCPPWLLRGRRSCRELRRCGDSGLELRSKLPDGLRLHPGCRRAVLLRVFARVRSVCCHQSRGATAVPERCGQDSRRQRARLLRAELLSFTEGVLPSRPMPCRCSVFSRCGLSAVRILTGRRHPRP